MAATAAAVAFLLAGAGSAWAAPADDAFVAATQIAGLPFTDTLDASTATIEPGEPQFCNPTTQSVWYAITPTQAATLEADTNGSGGFAQVTVYRADASGFAGLTFIGCANFGPSRAVFQVQAGSTYYLQAGPLFGSGAITVNLASVPVPANDDFAAATPIAAAPFSDSVDLTAATVEPGEPGGCQGAGPPAQPTVWYSFTPTQTGSYVFSGGSSVAAYTGGSLTSLTQVGCSSFTPLYFHADAGVPVHLQVAGGGPFPGPSPISLGVAPAAMASFFFSPSDPSTLDTVQFFDATFDPAGIASRVWQLGDGTTSTACCGVQHRYTTDGDYTAKLAVTTTDGRQAQTSQVVHVRTHDVAISAFSAPKQARVGKTKSFAIGLSNTRYAETVEVSLLRSVAGGGFEQVGQVTTAVPVRKRGTAATFDIDYTFAASDATFGKVSFEAVATLVGDRDANPADNTVTAVPTKVKG